MYQEVCLPFSASCPVNGNVKDEEYLPFGIGFKGMHSSFFEFRMMFKSSKSFEKSSSHYRDFLFTIRNEFW